MMNETMSPCVSNIATVPTLSACPSRLQSHSWGTGSRDTGQTRYCNRWNYDELWSLEPKSFNIFKGLSCKRLIWCSAIPHELVPAFHSQSCSSKIFIQQMNRLIISFTSCPASHRKPFMERGRENPKMPQKLWEVSDPKDWIEVLEVRKVGTLVPSIGHWPRHVHHHDEVCLHWYSLSGPILQGRRATDGDRRILVTLLSSLSRQMLEFDRTELWDVIEMSSPPPNNQVGSVRMCLVTVGDRCPPAWRLANSGNGASSTCPNSSSSSSSHMHTWHRWVFWKSTPVFTKACSPKSCGWCATGTTVQWQHEAIRGTCSSSSSSCWAASAEGLDWSKEVFGDKWRRCYTNPFQP